MNAQTFEQIINGLLNPQTANEANNALLTFLSDPQSIIFLFSMIEQPPSEQIKQKSISFLNTYMKKHYDSLDPQFQLQIIDKLVKITFSEQPQYSKQIYPILCDYIEGNIDQSQNLLQIIDNCIANNTNVITAMNVLAELIPNFEKNTSVIISNQAKFYQYSFSGLQSKNWELIIPSMVIFFYTKTVNPGQTVEPHYDIIINLSQDQTLYQHEEYFGRYWSIIGDSISQNLIPLDKLTQLYNVIITFSSNENIPYNFRFVPLRALLGIVDKLDFEKLSQVINLVFSISISFVQKEESIPNEYFELITKSLMTFPKKDVYMMLKQRIEQLLSLNNRAAHVVSICIYSIIFDVAPDAAFSDISSIIANLMSALDKNDVLLNTAVCIVLMTFEDSFRSVDVFALPFLPRIVPFIISPNNELRQYANFALHTLCNIITVPIPNFFNALWQIRGNIPPTEFEHYLEYLATAIEKSENVGDAETETLKNYILPFLMNLEDVDTGSEFLTLVTPLLNLNESLFESLLPPSLNVVKACLMKPDTCDSALISCIDFMSNIFQTFGNKFYPQFQEVIQAVVNLLFANDDGGKDEISILLNVQSAALDMCCTIAHSTKDPQLAQKLQEICIDFFTRDYEKEMLQNFDDDDEIEDENDLDALIEDAERDAITQGSHGSCQIAKLLNDEDAKQLFENIFSYIIETPDAKCAAEALKPITKLLHIAKPEAKPLYLKKCGEILNKIIDGSFPALEGQKILSGQIDLFLMTNIAYLIAEFVRYPSPTVDILCEFMIQIIKSSLDTAYLYAFIGAYSDVIKFKTGSIQASQAIINLIPQLLQNAKDPDTKQNLAYLLIIVVQFNPQSLQSIVSFVPVLQNWYLQGKQSPNGHQRMLSNIASAFLTFFASGMPIDLTLLNEAVEEFPPFDTPETAPMIQNMATVFGNNQVDPACIQNAALALSRFFVLNDVELSKRKVSPELMNVAHHMFVTFSKSNPQIIQSVLQKYQNSKTKLAKLNAVLQV